jgi:hypothetical protein
MTMTVDGVEIGRCLYGTEVGIVDYSRKERDTFGNITLIERGYSDLVRYNVIIETAQASTVRALLALKRAVSAAYVGSADHDITHVTGYLQSFSIDLQPNYSPLTLEVEGEVHG